MSAGAAALRTLGLSRARAITRDEVKTAFRELAKKWHPDGNQGGSKQSAEAKFKELQNAYQLLSAPGGLHEALRGDSGGPSSSGRPGQSRTATPQQDAADWWGEEKHYGAAHKSGYNAYGGYMGFNGAGGQGHWYEDTANAAKAEDHSRMLRSWLGVALFGVGLGFVCYTGRRDSAAKARGELVDAWWNQSTRRWEKPQPHMFKDPLLSGLIHLKPPSVVHNATQTRQQQRKQSVTLDGVRVRDSYRAREQGHRS